MDDHENENNRSCMNAAHAHAPAMLATPGGLEEMQQHCLHHRKEIVISEARGLADGAVDYVDGAAAEGDGTITSEGTDTWADAAARFFLDARKALEEEDITQIGQLVRALREMECTPLGQAWAKMLQELDVQGLCRAVMDKYDHWRLNLQSNAFCDIYHPTEQKWYECQLLQHEDKRTRVHFLGWNSKYDEFWDLSTVAIVPRNVYTKGKSKKFPQKIMWANSSTQGAPAPTVSGTVVRTSSGRKVKTVVTDNNVEFFKPSSKRQKSKSNEAEGGDDEKADHNEWLCSICTQLQADTDLILCDGPCKRSFHLGCLGVSASELPDGDWNCDECQNKRHTCFICGMEGEDDSDVAKCNVATCGKFYHMGCLASCGEHYEMRKQVTVSEEGHQEADFTSFKCPYHFCSICYSFYKGLSRGYLFKCISCPRAFHANCIPPGAKYNSMVVLCPMHPEEALPSVELAEVRRSSTSPIPDISANADTSENGTDNGLEVEAEVTAHLTGDEDDFRSFWAQLPLPNRTPDSANLSDDHFRLPESFKDDLSEKVPVFKHIFKNDYGSLPMKENTLPLHMPEALCECVDACGETCWNRTLKIECFNTRNGGGVCNVGGNCGNRRFANREYVKVRPVREAGRGWGAVTDEEVPEGRLVLEYVGEVIDESDAYLRMAVQRQEHPSDHNFYIMELEKGYFVDGKIKGNLSRFVNHSCDPNCELQRWVVNGRMRIGIFAKRNIQAGESISYDYQFATADEDAHKCCCGAVNCRGTLAPKKKLNKASMSRLEKHQFVRIAKQQEQKLLEEVNLRKDLTGRFVPGDKRFEVTAGPQAIFSHSARIGHLFLPRAARAGEDFVERRALTWKRARTHPLTRKQAGLRARNKKLRQEDKKTRQELGAVTRYEKILSSEQF